MNRIKTKFLLLLVVIIILALGSLIYVIMPKYQIYAVGDTDRALIIKLNTITGETSNWYLPKRLPGSIQKPPGKPPGY